MELREKRRLNVEKESGMEREREREREVEAVRKSRKTGEGCRKKEGRRRGRKEEAVEAREKEEGGI